jgi:hypothetical protein
VSPHVAGFVVFAIVFTKLGWWAGISTDPLKIDALALIPTTPEFGGKGFDRGITAILRFIHDTITVVVDTVADFGSWFALWRAKHFCAHHIATLQTTAGIAAIFMGPTVAGYKTEIRTDRWVNTGLR